MSELRTPLLCLFFSVLLTLVLLLVTQARSKLYRILALREKSERVLRAANNYEQNVHLLVIGRQILLFFLPFCVALLIFGVDTTKQQLTSLFVLGLSIEVFWVAYLPVLTRARLYIDFGVDELKDMKPEMTLNADSEYTIYTRIYNLGFSTLKNAVVLIYFGSGFGVVPFDDARYKQLDFSKFFSVQKVDYGVAFTPTHDNYQNLPPQEWFLFPLIIKTPKSPVSRNAEIQVYSENSWGLSKYPFLIQIAENKPRRL
jgi:hypothetical protein